MSMSSDDLDILGRIDDLDALVQRLRAAVVSAGDDTARAASAVMDAGGSIANALELTVSSAAGHAEVLSHDLFRFLADADAWRRDADAFWGGCFRRLGALAGANEDLRRLCLHRTYPAGRTPLLQQLCRLNPPAKAVEMLLGITPLTNGTDEDRYGHMVRNARGEYALQVLLENGGSLDAAKLLIGDEDEEVNDEEFSDDGVRCMKTLKLTDGKTSAYQALIDNKEKYDAEAFSEILRYLVLMDTSTYSALLHEHSCEGPSKEQIPLALLWKGLRPNISLHAAMTDNDFEFLLKATCYMHLRTSSPESMPEDYNERGDEIDRVPLLQAFLVCSPCFGEWVIRAMFGHFFASDGTFLLEKNAAGDYPIHVMVASYGPPQFLTTGNNKHCWHHFKSFIIEKLLQIAPQCARQVNDDGRYPLHVAADREHWVDEREALLGILVKAYPEALSICDRKTGLPVFALTVRDEYEDKYQDIRVNNAFLLLREQPDIISDFIPPDTEASAKSDTLGPPPKRARG